MEKEKPQYQKCPNCESESLTEWTHELARQSGVRLTADGNLDYDVSEGMKIEGNTIKVTGYKCDGCSSQLVICNGKLTEAPTNNAIVHDITGLFRLDECNFTAMFDATPWFATAGDDRITALARSGFAHDYPADEVATEMAEHVPILQTAFMLHEELGGGTDCVINALEAMVWIGENRPHIYNVLKEDKDLPVSTSRAIEELAAQKSTPTGGKK